MSEGRLKGVSPLERLVAPEKLGSGDQQELSALVRYVDAIRSASLTAQKPILLDMRNCRRVDPSACVVIQAEIDRAKALHGVNLRLRHPRERQSQFTLKALGVHESDAEPEELHGSLSDRITRIVSGARNDPSPGESIFEVAKLAEGLGDALLADRVHAALNEAADNVLSWAYEPLMLTGKPQFVERWWVAGILYPGKDAIFIALDHGLTIPVTAPKNLGSAMQAAISALQGREAPSEGQGVLEAWQTLLATIRYKRTRSRKDERGKGLASMIDLIDLFRNGTVRIFSGPATYAYVRQPQTTVADESCVPLGFHFPGTMIMWRVKATKAAKG